MMQDAAGPVALGLSPAAVYQAKERMNVSDRPRSTRRGVGLGAVAAVALTPILVPIAAPAAVAAPDDSQVVISEFYGRGGSANQPYQQKFVELFNPTDGAIDLAGMSLQYRSATGTGSSNNTAALTGTIEPGGHFLVIIGSNGDTGADLSGGADLDVSINAGGSNGVIALVNSTSAVALPTGSVATGALDGAVVDVVGYGTSNTFEGSGPAEYPGTNPTPGSIERTEGADSDDNSADFTFTSAPTPQGTGGEVVPGPDPDPDPDPEPGGTVTIEEIQGTGDETPLNGQRVTTRGVVTATYPTGGFNGFTIQTEGTGGDLSEHTASSGIFVFAGGAMASLDIEIGDFVEVAGTAGEYFGLTQLSNPTVTPLEEEFTPVVPVEIAWPETDAERELYESMLMLPTNEFTVSNTYFTLQYGEVGLAAGTEPLVTPTEVANPNTDPDGVAAAEADNAARGVVLNDGSSFNLIDFRYEDHEIPLPYVTPEAPLRTGAAATFTNPVIVDFRRVQNGDSAWSFQPTTRATGENYTEFVSFENTRTEAPDEVGGNLQIASFNVLNYFATLGTDESGCGFYGDRDGDPTTARDCTVRGAYDAANFDRQEEKIVEAINSIGADVIALEEIEASQRVGGNDRDFALATLVDALNADAGAEVWSYVESPAEVPSNEDVIRTALIYRVDSVVPVGESAILLNSSAFGNAREPLAQEFAPLTSSGEQAEDTFVVAVNHFKSKGSGTDDGTGQGNANPDRIAQAGALVEFVEDEYGADEPVFLAGDFNSYTQEDPMQVLYEAGYENLTAFEHSGAYTYSFDGMAGSLDHILANEAAAEYFVGSTVWEINANEPLALEYSRYNYNVTNFHDASPYRASDHNPGIVGLNVPVDGEEPAESGPATLTVLNNLGDTVGSTAWQFEDAAGNVFTVGDNGRNAPEGSLEDTSGDWGVLTFEGLPAGEYTVTNLSHGSSAYAAPEPFTVTVTGEEQDLGTVEMAGAATTTVYTLDENEERIPGATYRLEGADGQSVEVTDGGEGDLHEQDGYVRFGGLGLGTYTITLVSLPDGYVFDESQELTVELTAGTPHRFAGGFVAESAPVDPDPEPVPPTPGRGFYLNDGWDGQADHEFSFGRRGDTVLVGDWDGDGSDTLAVRRGNAYFLSNSLYGGAADVELTFGRASDTVLVGDWDGDGVDTLAVRRGNAYFLINSLAGGNAEVELTYGRASDTVLVGDWDGDGVDTLGVRRGDAYFLANSLAGGNADVSLAYGRASDRVLVGDWDGDGVDTFAVRRGNQYLVSNTLTGGWADQDVRYGRAGDDVFVGDWDGDGSDTLGVRR
jgi:predicted extracellular nuclease